MKVKFYEDRYSNWTLSFEYDDVPVPRVGEYVRGFPCGSLVVKEVVWDYSEKEVYVRCDY